MSVPVPGFPARRRERLLAHGVVAAVVYAAASTAPMKSASAQSSPPTALPAISVETQQSPEEAAPYRKLNTSQPKYGGELLDTPQSVTVVTEELMDEQHVTRLRDALRNVPGISLAIGEGGNQGDTIFLRGFSTRTDLYLDGVRDFGSYNRDVFALDSVEVLKGASSTIFGRGSTGGVINNVSKVPKLTNLNEVELSGGTNPSGRGTGDFNYVFGDASAIRMNVMAEDSSVTDRDITENRRWGLFPSITFGIGKPLEVNFNYFHQQENNIPDYGVPFYFGRPAPVDRSNFYGYADFDYERTHVDVVTNRVKYDISSAITLNNTLRFAREDRAQSPTSPRLPAGITENTPLSSILVTRSKPTNTRTWNTYTNQSDFLVSAETWGMKHTINTGIELTREVFDTTSFSITNIVGANFLNPNPFQPNPVVGGVSISSKTVANTAAGYGMDKVAVTDWLDLLGGIRFDRFSAHFNNNVTDQSLDSIDRIISGRAAAIVKPTDWQSYYFNWGTSANPSAEALALANNVVDLTPETSTIYEIGAKYDLFDKRLGIQAAAYNLVKHNARVPDPSGSGLMVLQGKQTVNGGELSAQGKLTDKWQIMTGFSVMRSHNSSTVASTNAKELINVPDFTFNLWSTYDVTPKWQVGGGAFYVGNYFADPANQNQVPSYLRFDTMTAYKVNELFSLRLNVLNLFNKQYYEATGGNVLPGAGRTAILSGYFKF